MQVPLFIDTGEKLKIDTRTGQYQSPRLMAAPSTRREARERAVELLYEADTKSVHPEDVVAALPLRPDEYALELAYGVADHRSRSTTC